jgi:hypothetical protein
MAEVIVEVVDCILMMVKGCGLGVFLWCIRCAECGGHIWCTRCCGVRGCV